MVVQSACPTHAEAVGGELQLDWQDPQTIGLCRTKLEQAWCAYRYRGTPPAPGGTFPQWQFTCGGHDQRGDEALRVIGQVRRPSGDEEGYAAVIELAFRGSMKLDAWFEREACELTNSTWGDGHGQVHRGFAEAYTLMQESVLLRAWDGLQAMGLELSPRVLVQACGHSVGGALATLAAYDLGSRGCSVRCITWGSPRVGNQAFAQSYQRVVWQTMRFAGTADPVPRLPLSAENKGGRGRGCCTHVCPAAEFDARVTCCSLTPLPSPNALWSGRQQAMIVEGDTFYLGGQTIASHGFSCYERELDAVVASQGLAVPEPQTQALRRSAQHRNSARRLKNPCSAEGMLRVAHALFTC